MAEGKIDDIIVGIEAKLDTLERNLSEGERKVDDSVGLMDRKLTGLGATAGAGLAAGLAKAGAIAASLLVAAQATATAFNLIDGGVDAFGSGLERAASAHKRLDILAESYLSTTEKTVAATDRMARKLGEIPVVGMLFQAGEQIHGGIMSLGARMGLDKGFLSESPLGKAIATSEAQKREGLMAPQLQQRGMLAQENEAARITVERRMELAGAYRHRLEQVRLQSRYEQEDFALTIRERRARIQSLAGRAGSAQEKALDEIARLGMTGLRMEETIGLIEAQRGLGGVERVQTALGTFTTAAAQPFTQGAGGDLQQRYNTLLSEIKDILSRIERRPRTLEGFQ